MIYLDYNATTPIDRIVLDKMMPYFKDMYGNPSSVYRFAQNAKRAVEDARAQIAQLIGADIGEIYFTSGGTEADNMAIKGVAALHIARGNHIITSKIEHHAVLHPVEYLEKNGFKAAYINVDEFGVVDVGELEKSITKETILISVMHANNEVGTIQPIKEIANICNKNNVYFHTDAVQSAGKLKINVKDLGVGLLSLSSHKICGPKGVGALYVKKGVKISPILHGGGHEKGLRSGTENVAGIVGFGQAAELIKEELSKESHEIKNLRDKLEKGIFDKITEVKLNGHPKQRLDNTLNVSMKCIEGEGILINLDFDDICASSGSACTSGSLDPSHVLLAMGLDHETAHGSLRFSLGRFTESKEIDKVLEVLPSIIERLRKISPFWQKK